ncbi:hypothetical protein FEM48_Zijuj07G0143700 [Ziziphus jujuba var. spinosa]|uniref:Uncharacterized protein n=1 Tax=Ziziphus jujuba var. spinosa TaxID=714518 RepID=A0A978V553_ZIZJJ|nr:hypothetical protein FEM48_Zijuj07G0143700 [Ziziphus jujuba var. spinosa]
MLVLQFCHFERLCQAIGDSTVLAYALSELNRWHNYGIDLLLLSALDRSAMLKVDKLATGHNAADVAETVLLNILRGDIARIFSFKITGIYSPNAYHGFACEFIKDLERIRAILDIIKSGEDFRISTSMKMPEQGTCEGCGYIASQTSMATLQGENGKTGLLYVLIEASINSIFMFLYEGMV